MPRGERHIALSGALGMGAGGVHHAAAEHRAEHDSHLKLGERGTEAPAHAAAERDPAVGRRRAIQKPLRPKRERLGIEVGPRVGQQIAGVTSVPAGSVSPSTHRSQARRLPASGTTGRSRSDS